MGFSNHPSEQRVRNLFSGSIYLSRWTLYEKPNAVLRLSYTHEFLYH